MATTPEGPGSFFTGEAHRVDLREDGEALHGVNAHLYIEDQSGTVVLDEDVNRVEITTVVRWATWEPGLKAVQDQHELSMGHLAKIEITPCRDRLKREPDGSSS